MQHFPGAGQPERRNGASNGSTGISAAAACLALTACASVVVPPAAPADPQTVYLLDHGQHSSLVLPAEDALVRYEYGDWAWMALDRRGLGAVWGALFCPSPAALGRRELPGAAAVSVPLATIGIPIESAHALEVDGGAVERLRASLEALYRAQRREAIENPRYDLEFVRHPEAYTLGHNSNSVVAGWLEGLGCRVEGPRRWASWVVRMPLDAAANPPPPRPARGNGRTRH